MQGAGAGSNGVRLCAVLLAIAVVTAAASPVAAESAAARPSPAGVAGTHERAGESAARLQLLADGEALLAAGDAVSAEAVFDRAALLEHAGDTELALVRMYLQAGDYRRALSFAAHAAGAHHDEPGATALYVLLLQLGGQHVVAIRLLEQALAERPDDRDLRRVQTLIDGTGSIEGGVAGAPTGDNDRRADAVARAVDVSQPVRLAPYAVPASDVPAGAHVAGSGVLVRGGSRAVAPARTLGGARQLWVRNGLGQTVPARLDRVDADSGLALLRLPVPLSPCAGMLTSAAAPFAGGPAVMVDFGMAASSEPAWPQLRTGFFGRQPAFATAARPLGIEAPPGPLGGPVFDAAGRLAGVAMAAADGAQHLLAVDRLAAVLGEPPAPAAPDGRAVPVAIESVYECALRVTLQIVVQR